MLTILIAVLVGACALTLVPHHRDPMPPAHAERR
jgi:hypothetical protein